ncbi:T9SS type A sorting domain-containing protein [Stygiobacter electus]|uniref:T9SS type A sorting domain-containing protein n=1 Tax=Stygiobacter electus TaxID=3032292 RepID=A0AAE3P427_9BACT|nr:T9SS type A sorting domain-containing protein [Stygiobacter electus]MDF1612833.1 T9SS type A sorting domain-containing protein [Stygiobacter electus]
MNSFFLNAQNINLSNGKIFEGEPFLRVNPNNSQHLVLVWMGYDHPYKVALYYRVSFDAGNTWSNKAKIQQTNSVFSAADPSIDFDNQGNVYLSYVEFVSPPNTTDSGGIFMRKSTDGGLTWQSPVKVMDLNSDPGKRAIDRPWLRVDRSSGSSNGNIYITSMNMAGVTTPPFNPYLHRSFDGGNTWEAYKYIDTAGWLSGNFISHPMSTPDVSATGVFHAIYPSYDYTQNPYPRYIHVKSSDSGNTLNYNTVFYDTNNVNDSFPKKGYLLRVNPINPQHLIFFYLAKNYGDIDVFARESYDGGMTWAGPQRINDDPVSNKRMQDLVWAEFNQHGDLFVAWRDRRNAPDSTFTTSSEIWGSVKWHDSTDFAVNFKISDNLVPYDSILGATSGNDFMCVQFSNDTAYAVWGSNTTGTLNIWFQRINLSNLTNVNIESAKNLPSDYTLYQNYPNPFNPSTTINFSLPKTEYVTLNVFDALGNEITTLVNAEMPSGEHSVVFDAKNLSSGVYFYKLQSGEFVQVNKMILMK